MRLPPRQKIVTDLLLLHFSITSIASFVVPKLVSRMLHGAATCHQQPCYVCDSVESVGQRS
jgi:hypothetical protein